MRTDKIDIIGMMVMAIGGCFCMGLGFYLISNIATENVSNDIAITSSWSDPANDKTAAIMMQEDYYIVTIDGQKHYCTDVEYIAGYPLMIILHRGDDTRTEKADKSIVVEHR